MKKIIFLVICSILIHANSNAQAKPKQKDKEKAPTQKEMEELMKEAQKEMDDLDPEAKRMMDSMGIKMPSFKDIPKVSDKQLAEAYENETRIVPLKDAARIASISKTSLSNAAMPAFLQSVHEQLINKLDPYTNESGEKIYQWAKNKYHSVTATGNAAVGFWMMGKPGIALYIMSKACQDNQTDADNLNNFSALLTMAGAEQLAIPILDNLNKQFPKNSTILNNIGQAWFGLGEITKAEKYIDSTLRIYAYHSQANLTKSLIEENKGNKEAAIQAVKRSIKNAYSMEKENRLNKLGYKLKSDDLDWDQPMPQDPLGLEKFNWPDYPKNVAQSDILEKQWSAFIAVCKSEITELKIKEKRLESEMLAANQKRIQQIIQAGQNGIMIDPVPRFAKKAIVKLKYLVDGKDGKLAFSYQKKGEAVTAAMIKVSEFEEILSAQLKALEEKYEDQFGEGKPNPFAAACADENKVKDNFLNQANTLLQFEFTDYLNFMRRMLNDQMYYYQYTMWPEEFEVAKIQAKISWLNMIKDQGVKFKKKGASCGDETIVEKGPFKLGQFDDMHCEYHSELKLGIGTINSDCSMLTAKLDINILKNTLNIEVVKLGWKTKQGDSDNETFLDQFQSASVEVGLKKGVGIGTGPLKAEAKIGTAGFVEIDRNGISDAGIKVSADIKAGTNIIKPLDGTTQIEDHSMGPVKDQSVSIIGTEAKISINSGFTVEGKGILKGLKK